MAAVPERITEHVGPITSPGLQLRVASNGVVVHTQFLRESHLALNSNDEAVFNNAADFAAWCKRWFEHQLNRGSS